MVEVYGVPVLWKANSSEAELIQAVEGCMYTESLMTTLVDLGLPSCILTTLLPSRSLGERVARGHGT